MRRLINAAVACAVLGGIPVVAPDITIMDTVGTGTGWWSASRENNEVEPGCLTTQAWDMEAFLFDSVAKKLQLQGGYNMRDGYGGFYGGDLFIDVNGDAKWGVNTPSDTTSGGYDTRPNSSFLWDYVVVFDRVSPDPVASGGSAYKVVSGSTGYSVYSIAGTATDLEVYYSQNNSSNPFRYLSGGQLVSGAGGTVSQTSFIDGEGTHYLLGDIDLGFLANKGTAKDGNLTFHWTIGCGNDNLMGRTASWVPDGGMTMALLGISLSTLGLVSARVRRSA